MTLHQLKTADWLAELLAFAHVGQNHVVAALHDAQRAPREHNAFEIQAAHEHSDTGLAEGILHWDPAIGKYQLAGIGATHAQFVELLRGREAGKPVLDDERGNSPGAGRRIGGRVDHDDVSVGPVRDPHLTTIEHVVVAREFGAEPHTDHVGSRVRLAHGKGAHRSTRDQIGEVTTLLRLAGVAANLVHAKVGMSRVAQANRRRSAANLFHGDHMVEIPKAATSERLVDGQAEQPKLAELIPQIGRKRVGPVDLVGARRDFIGGEPAHGLTNQIGGLAEIEHRRVVDIHLSTTVP